MTNMTTKRVHSPGNSRLIGLSCLLKKEKKYIKRKIEINSKDKDKHMQWENNEN